MNLVLMRHPQRRQDCVEAKAPLTPEGLKRARETAFEIAARIPSFDLVLRSETEAAKQAADQLQEEDCVKVAASRVSYVLCPNRQQITLPEIEQEWKNGAHTVAIIGHHPGITSLLINLTGKQCRTIDRGEAIWVEMQNGKGYIRSTFGSRYSAELLREKVGVKMTVCTFLAAFNIPVLVELVKDASKGFTWCQAAATVCFTVGFGLFVFAIYTYDLLQMPREYWGPVEQKKQPKKDSRSTFAHNYTLNGRLYAYMVWTWRWVFTPAVSASALGLVFLIVENWTAPNGLWVAIGCIGAILASLVAYLLWRPRLGVDD